MLQRLLGVLLPSLEHADEDDEEEEEDDGQDGAHDPHHGGLLGVGQALGVVAEDAVAGLGALRGRA